MKKDCRQMVRKKKQIDLDNMTILAVDDMKSMRLTLRKMLRHLNLGKNLKFAENGREGLNVLHSSTVDLAIIDWRMPVMNGTQMLEHIRNDKTLRDLPVIMVSAEADRDIVMEVAETEIDGYLLKPLTLDSLDSKIKEVVDKANNPDQATILIEQAREDEEIQDYESAIEKLKKALAFRPKASRLIRNLGLLYGKAGNDNMAEKCLLKAVSVNYQDAISRQILADMYFQRDDLRMAAKYYIEAVSLTTRFSEEALEVGEALLMKGYRKYAVDIFAKIISSKKNNFNDKQRIADICLEFEEHEYAKELLDSMIKEYPSKYDIVYKAGKVYAETGDYDKALEYLLNVDRYQSSRTDVKLDIAKIYYHQRKLYQADDYVNRILQKDPGNRDALALRKSI